MKLLVAILATFLAPASVSAADSFDQGPNGLNCAFCAPLEFDRLVVLLGDDKLREVVCRLSVQPFTPGKLSSAIGLPEGQVLRRTKTLQGWGVIRLVRRDSATTVIEPHAGGGGRTLRRWAKNILLIRDTPHGDAVCSLCVPYGEVTDMAVKVASRLRGMSDEAFREAFGREEQCRAALVQLRWPDGFVCPSCGHRGHCLLAGRGLYQCNRCKRQTSPSAGTIFHATKLPLTL